LSAELLAAELADLQEVIDTLVEACGLSNATVRALQEQRRADRGAFANRLRLPWTECCAGQDFLCASVVGHDAH
jgi:hypothetical protein